MIFVAHSLSHLFESLIVEFDAFLSHNWGKDSKGRKNHDRVMRFKGELEKYNTSKQKYWLDEDEMNGEIVQKMCDGIEKSKVVIVFITQSYIDKVAGRGPKQERDSCYLEFNYAARKKGLTQLIPVVMEDECNDMSQWDGSVGMHLGGQIYYSFTKDSELSKCVEEVSREIQRRIKDHSHRRSSMRSSIRSSATSITSMRKFCSNNKNDGEDRMPSEIQYEVQNFDTMCGASSLGNFCCTA